MSRHLPFIALLLLASAVNVAWADNWPSFRGPEGNGFSADKNLPVKWTAEHFLWKTKLPGPGAASPITWGDKVFVLCYSGYGANLVRKTDRPGPGGKGGDPFGKGMDPFDKGKLPGGEDPKQLRRHLLCLSCDTGAILWQQEIAPRLPEQMLNEQIREHGFASNTPVTDGERVYVFFGKTGVLAFDFTGKKLWQTDVGSGIYLYGSAASLALHGNLVFVNASAESKSLWALDCKTGKVAWRNKSITATWSSPVIVNTREGKPELVLSQPSKVVAYEPETGKELWHCKGLPVPTGGSSYCTPVAKDGIIYLAGGAGPGATATAFAVKAGGQGDVTGTHVLWRVKGGAMINSPVVCGDHLYIIDALVTCLKLDTGKTVYRSRFYDSRTDYASPVATADKIYQVTRSDGVHVMAAGNRFQALAHNEFQGDASVFNASPAVSNGKMFIRSNAYLYCIGKKE